VNILECTKGVLLVLISICGLSAAELPPPEREIPLYRGVAPGSEQWDWAERTITNGNGRAVVQNVVRPVLQYYPAPKPIAVGTAMIVAPGGGWHNLMMSYEGVEIAQRLNEMGVDAFVLKYRLTYTDPRLKPMGRPTAAPYPPNIRELSGADGRQAVLLVRQHAGTFGYRADRIGMIGFSAGGGVLLATVAGPVESRPNFAAAIYAADAGNTTPPPDGAPVMFIAVASDDRSVGYQGSLDLFSAWRKANIPVELHIFQTGQHGFGKKGGGADHFMDRLEEWLKVNGWLSK